MVETFPVTLIKSPYLMEKTEEVEKFQRSKKCIFCGETKVDV